MYESFYHLSANPFRLTPDPKFCFSHSAYQESHAYLQYAFGLGEGFILLTGRPGAGKTTLVESFIGSLDISAAVTARIAVTDFEASDLLRAVAYHFDLAAEGLDKATLLRHIEALFVSRVQAGRRVLLVIDEAQRLSHAALEELRMLADMQIGVRPLVQIFLVGQEALRSLMREPDMEQLQQRVIGTCRLGPLGVRETRSYVEHRLRRADWRGAPELTGAAILAVHDYSKGVPRHINKICTRLLLQGYMESKHLLDREDVQRVARELGEEQLAPLAVAESDSAATGNSVPAVRDAVPDLDELAVRAERPSENKQPATVRARQASRASAIAPATRVTAVRSPPVEEPPVRARPARAMTYPGLTTPRAETISLAWPGRFASARMAGLCAAVASLGERPAMLFSLVAAVTLSAGAVTSLVGGHNDTPLSAEAMRMPAQLPVPPGMTDEPSAQQGPKTLAGDTEPPIDASGPGNPWPGNGSGEAVADAGASTRTAVLQPPSPADARLPDGLPAPPAASHRPRQSLAAPSGGHSLADSAVNEVPAMPAVTERIPTPVASVAVATTVEAVNGDTAVTTHEEISAPPATDHSVLASVEVAGAAGGLPDRLLSDLLVEAEVALAEDRLLIPAGNCAYDYYRQVLQRDPANAHARQGMDRIVARYSVLAGAALERGDADKAALYVRRALRVSPGDKRLRAMRDNLKVATTPVPEPAPVPDALPPPVLDQPAKPGNFLRRLKAFFTANRPAATL